MAKKRKEKKEKGLSHTGVSDCSVCVYVCVRGPAEAAIMPPQKTEMVCAVITDTHGLDQRKCQ